MFSFLNISSVFAGALIGLGVWLVLLGCRGKAVLGRPGVSRAVLGGSGVGKSGASRSGLAGSSFKAGLPAGQIVGNQKKFIMAIVAGAVVFLITNWVAAALLVAGAIAIFWGKLSPQKQVSSLVDKGDAIASWIEMLYSTIAAGGGFEKAITASARSAPLAIRSEVETLAARVEVVPLPEALAQFAREVCHPACDKVATALTLASSRGAQNLVNLLRSQAVSVRQDGQLLRSQQAGRARFLTSARIVLGATLSVALGIYIFDNGYLSAYDSFFGQIMLCVVGAGFLGGYGLLVKMGKAKPPIRHFEA